MPLWCVDWWASKQTQRLRYRWSLLLWVQIWQLWVVYLAFRYQMKPATLSHNHMCIPSVWPCSNSFVESINSHAWTCSHKYTTHCPARIETNLSFLVSHRHTLTLSVFSSPHHRWLFLPLSLSLWHTHNIYVHIQGYCFPMLCPRSAWFQRSNTNSPAHPSVPSARNSDQQHPGTTRG